MLITVRVTIYALQDPRDGSLKYVGQTRYPWARVSLHISAARNGHSPKDQWVNELRGLGLRPKMIVLEEILAELDDCKYPDGSDYPYSLVKRPYPKEALAAEAAYIKKLRAEGESLLNVKSPTPPRTQRPPTGLYLDYLIGLRRGA